MDELLSRYNIRTDLAIEAQEIASKKHNKSRMKGMWSEKKTQDGITVMRLKINTEAAAQKIGKQIGQYVTLEVPKLRNGNTELRNKVAITFAREFEAFLKRLKIKRKNKVLVVGLGNWHVTPDALGPTVVENLWITRPYFEIKKKQAELGFRNVSAVAPGVLGTTGIESSDIVYGIVAQSNPDVLILIDALASRSLSRINTTIQITDTGILPGSGIGNKRKGLTKEVLGVPCIAIGVPTVVYASTIVSNTLELMMTKEQNEVLNKEELFGYFGKMESKKRLQLVREVLGPLEQDLLVTPKEVDKFVEDIGHLIASGLNAALHEAVGPDNMSSYTH